MVNSKDEMPLTKTEAIIDRLKEAVGVKSDRQLSKFLSISRQNIGAARARNDVPPGWLIKTNKASGYSLDWLNSGEGPRKLAGYEHEVFAHDAIGHDTPDYDKHGGWKPRVGSKEWELIGKAHEIMSSETVYRSALINNINAFHKALIDDRDKKEIEKRVEALEKQLKQLLENEHRRNNWQHKDPEPPAGESEIDHRSEQS